MARVRIEADQAGLDQIRALVLRMRNNALDDMKPEAVRNAPVDTGLLSSMIDVNHSAGILYADTEYAAAVELGSVPHSIPNAFGRGITVEHPGGPAQAYLRPAAYRERVLRA